MKKTVEQKLEYEMETNLLVEKYELLWMYRKVEGSWEDYQRTGKDRQYWIYQSHLDRFEKEFRRIFNRSRVEGGRKIMPSDPDYEEISKLQEMIAMAKNPQVWFQSAQDCSEEERTQIISTLETELAERLKNPDDEFILPTEEELLALIHENP